MLLTWSSAAFWVIYAVTDPPLGTVVEPRRPPAWLRGRGPTASGALPSVMGRLCRTVSQVWDSWYCPSSRFTVFWPRFRISTASLIHRWNRLLSLWTILAPSQSIKWFSRLQWSDIADFSVSCVACCLTARVSVLAVSFSHSFWCSFLRVPKARPVSPIYVFLHVWHGISYMTSHFFSGGVWSFGCTSIWHIFVCGLTGVLM